GGQQLAHAAVVSLRTDALLTGATRHRVLQVDGAWVIGFGPGDVRRAEQRDDRPAKRRGEVTRPAVGRDQDVGTTYTCLGQAKRQREVRQSADGRVPGSVDDASAEVALRRPAQHQDAAAARASENASE